MKIVAFTMITDPEYRQDPWEEGIRQALEVFDEVVVIYGREEDGKLLFEKFGPEKPALYTTYMPWPQPEWSWEELPKHLNAALEVVRSLGADWAIKFDIDHFFHENDKRGIRDKLTQAAREVKLLATFEKYQFFKVDRAYEKGKMPFALNLKHPLGGKLCYGVAKGQYTDLCQPLIEISDTTSVNGKVYKIPTGELPDPEIHRFKTGIHVWNYDYSFKTYERAKELLYYYEISHAKFWGAGQYGEKLEDLTMESGMNGFLRLANGRYKKCDKPFGWLEQPKHIREKIKNIKPEEFGHSLWNKITIRQ